MARTLSPADKCALPGCGASATHEIHTGDYGHTFVPTPPASDRAWLTLTEYEAKMRNDDTTPDAGDKGMTREEYRDQTTFLITAAMAFGAQKLSEDKLELRREVLLAHDAVQRATLAAKDAEIERLNRDWETERRAGDALLARAEAAEAEVERWEEKAVLGVAKALALRDAEKARAETAEARVSELGALLREIGEDQGKALSDRRSPDYWMNRIDAALGEGK